MERLITEQKDRQIGFQLRMNPVGKLFSDTNYFIRLNVCTNPTCNCGAVNMVIIKEENFGTSDVEYRLPIDVHKEEVRSQDESFYSKEGNGEYVQGLFKNGLTAEDWGSLRKEYAISKFELLDSVNPDEVDFEFEEEHHTNLSLMFFYADAFPCSEFYVGLNGKKYIIFDTYCKNPTCRCTNMLLSFYEVDEHIEEQSEATLVAEYFYNYKTKKGEIQKGSQTLISSILQGIYHNYRDPDRIFRKRSQVVKELYIKSKRTYDKARQARTPMKISRNQLCPCGSGKKYKRCCMKKEEMSDEMACGVAR